MDLKASSMSNNCSYTGRGIVMKVAKIKKLFTESANLKWIAKRNNDRYKKYLSSLLYNKKYKNKNLGGQ